MGQARVRVGAKGALPTLTLRTRTDGRCVVLPSWDKLGDAKVLSVDVTAPGADEATRFPVPADKREHTLTLPARELEEHSVRQVADPHPIHGALCAAQILRTLEPKGSLVGRSPHQNQLPSSKGKWHLGLLGNHCHPPGQLSAREAAELLIR